MHCYRHDITFPAVGYVTMTRWGVKACGHKLLLHRFRPHRDFEYHDHPWPFVTLVVWGAYVDESPNGRDRLRMGSIRRRSEHHMHRTSCARTTWTLVVTGRWRRAWCRGMDPTAQATWTCED